MTPRPEAEIAPKRRDVGGKSSDRVRGRRPALAVSGQVHADDPVPSREMIELRSEEIAIAAPPVQEQQMRAALTRRVECKPGCVSSRRRTGALSFDGGHCFLLNPAGCAEPRREPQAIASGDTP